MIIGARSMTRDILASVANSPALCPFWKDTAMACAIS